MTDAPKSTIVSRLAAVLAADVTGYTRFINEDSRAALEALDAGRQVFRDETHKAGGRIVDTAGDSVLAVFGSATSAVHAALRIQQYLGDFDAMKIGGRRMRFRIGVHIGEVLEKSDGTVYGDGVNFASRLQTLAQPGGVCISDIVAGQVRQTVDSPFEDIGYHQLKNVPGELHAFAWNPKLVADEDTPAATSYRRPRIFVEAFKAHGGPEAESLSAGVREMLSTALSNQSGIDVVHTHGLANYVLNANIHAAGERYRASMHIQDRVKGVTFGADRFDGQIVDPLDAQDDLVYKMYNAVRFAMHEREMEPVQGDLPTTDDPGVLMLRAGSLMFRSLPECYDEARQIMTRLANTDSRNFMVQAMKAQSHLGEWIAGWREIPAEDAEAARVAIVRAIAGNPNNDYVYFVRCEVDLAVEADPAAAEAAAKRSLELNPLYAFSSLLLGVAKIFAGRYEEGLALCQKVIDSEPRLQFAPWAMQFVALGEFARGDYVQALDWARRSDQRGPGVARTLVILVASAHWAGEERFAREAAGKLWRRVPDFDPGELGGYPFQDRTVVERIREGLSAASAELGAEQ
jgi:adenylate cyclase